MHLANNFVHKMRAGWTSKKVKRIVPRKCKKRYKGNFMFKSNEDNVVCRWGQHYLVLNRIST